MAIRSKVKMKQKRISPKRIACHCGIEIWMDGYEGKVGVGRVKCRASTPLTVDKAASRACILRSLMNAQTNAINKVTLKRSIAMERMVNREVEPVPSDQAKRSASESPMTSWEMLKSWRAVASELRSAFSKDLSLAASMTWEGNSK
jgi:hypothetical protein